MNTSMELVKALREMYRIEPALVYRDAADRLELLEKALQEWKSETRLRQDNYGIHVGGFANAKPESLPNLAAWLRETNG